MKKNGIQFNFQKSKQEEECFICSKKIDKGNDEYISEITPTMHILTEITRRENAGKREQR